MKDMTFKKGDKVRVRSFEEHPELMPLFYAEHMLDMMGWVLTFATYDERERYAVVYEGTHAWFIECLERVDEHG